MAPPDPILIASPTRCGTTMLAWLLHLHGVWIGEAKVTADPTSNPQVGTENTAIKRYLDGVKSAKPNDFRDRILALVHTDGRWLVKTACNLISQDVWMRDFPAAKWLLPRRPIADILRSRERRGVSRKDSWIIRQLEMQEKIAGADCDSTFVSADALCGGGTIGEEEARRVFGFCEIDFDPEVYHGWVQPERWHGGQA